MAAPITKHIIMLPFMAQGHLTYFLEFAYRLIHHNPKLTITIVNTTANINYLRSAISNRPSPPSEIHLKSLPFNSSNHGLPPNSENTDCLSRSQIPKLCHASTTLEASFRQFISEVVSGEGSPLVCIVSDLLMGWVNGVAKSFGIHNYTLTLCAYASAASISLLGNLPQLKTADGEIPDQFSLPGFPESCRFTKMELPQYSKADDEKDELLRFFVPQFLMSINSNGWLCNTVEEIETIGLQVLRSYFKLRVWCVGPLIPSKMLIMNSGSDTSLGMTSQRSGRKLAIEPKYCIEWLDSRPTRSVLYISFGSESAISETQMQELAKGLEESKKPFIWVIRPPTGFDPKADFRPEWLPSGYLDRVSKQGLVVYGWAPQLEILCHPSTGAFLSQCGWNSLLESLSQGVPLIGWPLIAEQAINVKMLVEELGVCMVLTRWANSIITKEEVRRVIDIVLDDTEGGKGDVMRKKAGKLQEMMRASVEMNTGSTYNAMNDFLANCFMI